VWIRESRCTDEVISLVLGLLINFLLATATKGVQLFLDFYSSTMVQHDGGNKYIFFVIEIIIDANCLYYY
jgi:hypothetical protein